MRFASVVSAVVPVGLRSSSACGCNELVAANVKETQHRRRYRYSTSTSNATLAISELQNPENGGVYKPDGGID